MTGQTSNSSWGAMTPIMPAFIRLIVGVIVLVVVEVVVLGFPGIYNNISGTQVTGANIAVFLIGLIVALILVKFGTQLTNAVSDAYKAYKNWTPLLAYFFQIVAIIILYSVTNGVAAPYFVSAPFAYPLIFLLLALIPTIKVAVNLVHAFDGSTAPKHGHEYQN